MAAPEPLGAIVNVITLAQLLYTGINDFIAADKDEESLVAQLRLSAVTLVGFVDTFRQVAAADLGAEELVVVMAACDLLQPDLEKMRNSLARISTQDSKWKRLGLKVAWVAYRKRQLEAVTANMRHWASLFNELKGSLNKEIRVSTSQGSSGGNSSRTRVNSLSTSSSSLAAAAATMDIHQLRRNPAEVQLQSTSGRLRAAIHSGSRILVEYKSYDSGTDEDRVAYIEEQIGRLSNFLSLADPITTGLLTSGGYFAEPAMYRFGFLFKIPPRYDIFSQGGPQTLRSVIAQGTPAATNPTKLSYAPKHCLDARVSAASMVATAVFFLHSYGWVHENLQTSNILMLVEKQQFSTKSSDTNSTSLPPLGRPFLVGFDGARSNDGIYSIGGHETAATEAEQFATDLFQHPQRQGGSSDARNQQSHRRQRQRYQMNHDIYSLGVALLEIGVWLPLDKERSARKSREREQPPQQRQQQQNETFQTIDSEERHLVIWETLMSLARNKLPLNLGEGYREIVLKCLGAQGEDAYDLSRFLYEIVWPLWEIKSCLSLSGSGR